MNDRNRFAAVVLAGDRHANDAVAVDAGVSCKALAPVAGTPMVCRVIQALEDSGVIKRIILIGPAELQEDAVLDGWIRAGRVERMSSLEGPSASAMAGLARLDPGTRALLTTADHALLRPDMVAGFLREAAGLDCDVAAGVIDYERMRAALPGVKRTVIRLADGAYCGCNLFAFLTPAGRRMAQYWMDVEQSRKKPIWLVAQLLGTWGILAYITGTLTLADALARLSGRTGVAIGAVQVTEPHAAVDVDTPADRRLAEELLESNPESTGSHAKTRK